MARPTTNKPSYDYKTHCLNREYIDIIEKLGNGLKVGPITLRLVDIARGRFREEINARLLFESGGTASHIAALKIFCGRGLIYKPWIEIFNINNRIVLENGSVIGFFDSPLEDALLDAITGKIGPGESIFIEYYNDEETLNQLERGVPPQVTRMGLKLLRRGFTWFKVWYYPEGFQEGGQKLQAQKPFNTTAMVRQLAALTEEINLFLNSKKRLSKDAYIIKSLLYSREALRIIDKLRRKASIQQ
ncbi:MAG: DUF1122 family protein [Desulfurococcales archaeon]|nr:DUF1122 family protein [Desulfurococcales archaeon]